MLYFPNTLPSFAKILLVSTIFIGACARIFTPGLIREQGADVKLSLKTFQAELLKLMSCVKFQIYKFGVIIKNCFPQEFINFDFSVPGRRWCLLLQKTTTWSSSMGRLSSWVRRGSSPATCIPASHILSWSWRSRKSCSWSINPVEPCLPCNASADQLGLHVGLVQILQIVTCFLLLKNADDLLALLLMISGLAMHKGKRYWYFTWVRCALQENNRNCV